MSVYDNGTNYKAIQLGIQVDRTTAALPATAAAAIFTVVGGRVGITKILGQVTTVIQTQANNTKLTANPTTGASQDLCTVLDITADAVGTMYGITGLNTDAMIGLDGLACPGQLRDVVVAAGTIDLDCAATNTGSVKWSIWFYPIDAGAYIEAA